MRKLIPMFTVVFALAALPMWAETLYISTEGRAGWSGRLQAPNAQCTDGPLPSLNAARDVVRTLLRQKGVGPITVLIRKGEYRLSEPFVLTPEDSGTPARPVIYAAYPGEHPAICGGRKIGGWTKAEGPAWTAKIPDVLGGKWYFRQLFVNGARVRRARTSNYGYYRMDGPRSRNEPFKLKFRGSDIKQEWAGHGVEVHGLALWADFRLPILNVDEEAHIAALTNNPSKPLGEANAKYYIENASDALDEPGEWFLDRDKGVLLYLPVLGEDMLTADVVAPVLRKLVLLEGRPEEGKFVRNVTFRGLRFCHTDWEPGPQGYVDRQAALGIGAIFSAIGVEDSAIEGCTIAHHGDYAIWFGRGCKRNRIVANEIFDMGAGGVKIGEDRMRESEAERNVEHVITDNHIHNLGLVYPSAIGIWIGQASNNTLSHNHIHDLYYSAISVGWTWGYAANQCKGNKIEYNHLHDIGKGILSDLGAIYTLGVQPGTVLRNNLIHDVQTFTYGGWGIYPDEGSSDMLIENNIVYQCQSAGFHQHYGRENKVRNNIFAFNTEYQLMRTRIDKNIVPFLFENNIVYFDQGRLLGTRWGDNQFKMNKNVYWDVRGNELRFAGMSFGQWQATGQDTASVIADPMFVDAENYNFKLSPNSPALRLGFKQIDMSTVGPRVKPGVPPPPAPTRRPGEAGGLPH